MSDLEALLKKHTDGVDASLAEFKGQVTTVAELVAALQKRADSAEAKANRLLIGVANDNDGAGVAVGGFGLRAPDDERKYMAAALKGQKLPDLDSKASQMQVGTESDGGILVPAMLRDQMEVLVRRQSPMRRVARVVELGANDKFPFSGTGTDYAWAGENDDRAQTNAPKIEGVTLPGGTIYALPQASEEAIDDIVLQLESFISDQVVDAMAEGESIAFIKGDGQKKPAGFLVAPQAATADGVRPFGTVQYIATGNATGFGTASPIDSLIALLMATKAGYRQAPGCAFVASTDFLANLAKLKDANNRPIYIPSPADNIPGSILGYPAIECEHMDAIGAGNFPVAFGNWQRGYVIGDRTKISVLRDPFTTKGIVKWYFRRRVHGSVMNSEAIKVLKVAAS